MENETAQLLELFGGPETSADESGVVASGKRDHDLLEKGELSLDEYLELAVDRALSQVKGIVEDEQLQAMRVILRQELQDDPTLMQYVSQLAQAAGSVPEGRDDSAS